MTIIIIKGGFFGLYMKQTEEKKIFIKVLETKIMKTVKVTCISEDLNKFLLFFIQILFMN